ncbi:aminoglycoside phosphotransferase family protein [Nocardia sp. R16R-3T]
MCLTEYTVEELTAENVTAMLRTQPQWQAVRVQSVASHSVGAGHMAESYRLHLTYEGAACGAPPTLIAKISSRNEASRRFAVASGAYQREVLFYQRLAAFTQVRTAACFYSEISDDLVGFILLLEDFGSVAPIDQLSGCTADNAALALSQAAALHGPLWGHPSLRTEKWLPIEKIWNPLAGSIPEIIGQWLDRFGSYLTEDQVSVIAKLGKAVPRWLQTIGDYRTLWHGDFRLDNLLFGGPDSVSPIAVVDWQALSAGPGIIDVSFFLGTSLSAENRLRHERDLVAEYFSKLRTYGIDGYTFDRCWLEYRVHSLYALMVAVPVSMNVEKTVRGDAMFAAMAGRGAEQVSANESYAALQLI